MYSELSRTTLPYHEVEINESVPTDSNAVVIYDEVKVDERVIDSSVPITDNPAYGTSFINSSVVFFS